MLDILQYALHGAVEEAATCLDVAVHTVIGTLGLPM